MSALFVMDAPGAPLMVTPFPLNVMPPTSTSPDTVTVQPSSANTAVEPGIQAVVPLFQLRLVESHVPSPPLHVRVSAPAVQHNTAQRPPNNMFFVIVALLLLGSRRFCGPPALSHSKIACCYHTIVRPFL